MLATIRVAAYYSCTYLGLHIWQLPYSRAGFERVNLTAAAADVSGDALRVELRHEEEGGGAFAAIVLGGAEHPFALVAWGRAELESLESGRLVEEPSDFALHVELWRADGAHPYSLHAPFTPNESQWHMALLEVDLVRVT